MYKYLQSTQTITPIQRLEKTGSASHKEKLLTYLVSHSHNNPSLNYTILQSERDTNMLTNRKKTHTSRPGYRMKSESEKQSQEDVKKIIKKGGMGVRNKYKIKGEVRVF